MKFFPIQALSYNTDKIDLNDVVIPPYDNISPEEEKAFLARHPNNFAHIVMPRSDDPDYAKASERLRQWETSGVLKRHSAKEHGIYQQEFEWKGVSYRRNTLLTGILLSDFEQKEVRPHERTHQGPREDRLRILRNTQCNLSAIFGVVSETSGALERFFESQTSGAPTLETKTDDGITHRVWSVSESAGQSVQSLLSDKPLYIVDGHHRYLSALAYAKEVGAVGNPEHPASVLLCAVANAVDPALLVFPTHRLIKKGGPQLNWDRVAEQFETRAISYEDACQFTETVSPTPSVVVYHNEKFVHCTPKARLHTDVEALGELSVLYSDQVLLADCLGLDEKARGNLSSLEYEKHLDRLWSRRGEAEMLALLPPIPVETILRVADNGGFMPQKSTFFYPKIAAGFWVRALST